MLKEIITSDGSKTFFNEEVQETYHSKSGAEEEAQEKYAKLVSKYESHKDEIVIYDFCFGLGYNSAAVIDQVKNKKLRIYCFENDKKILGKIPLLNASFNSYSIIKEFVNKFLLRCEDELITPMAEIRMIYGDAKKTITKKIEHADYVFFDPFSPSKAPDMWSEELFKEIYKKMNPAGLLFTYSCSKTARKNMEQAGFEVTDGPIVGRKNPSTIAKKPL